MKSTKVLLVGDDSYDMYVNAFYIGFIELGYKNVRLFSTNKWMKASSFVGSLWMRIQNKLAWGYDIKRLNEELIGFVEKEKPQLVFLYSTRLIRGKTIRKIKEKGSIVFAYNNDDPFASFYPKYFWRHYRQSLKYVDKGFVYRHKNIADYKASGCDNVELLRAYYIKQRNYYVENPNVSVPEVVFLGHNENDEREYYIKGLLDKKIKVGLMQKSWELFEANNPYLVKMEDTHTKYNEMLNAAKIAIVFLSKINNDTYTRRCFEIPVTKTMMVAPYTEDLATMFEADKEIVFYKNKEEFVEKIEYYLNNPDEREKIAEAAYKRILHDGHEACDRVEQVMTAFWCEKSRRECYK